MTFDPHVDINTILAIITVASGFFYFVTMLKSDVRNLTSELKNIRERISDFATRVSKLEEVLVAVAAQGERLNTMDVRANTLRQNVDAINTRLTVVENIVGKSATRRIK